MRLRTLAFASIAAAGMGTTFMATPAPAVQQPRHCVVNVSDANARMACYASFTAAIAKAANGRITDARLEADPQAISPIEIAFEDANFEGSTLTFTADRDCTPTRDDIDFSVADLFDFEIRSYRNFRGCSSKHYEFAGFTGRSVGWDGDGELPFPAKSVQWS